MRRALAIGTILLTSCCARPVLPPGRPTDMTAELEARLAGWQAMTVASVDTATGAVTLLPAAQGTPAGRISVLAPFLDVQSVLADRARHMAYEAELVDAVGE